MDRVKTRILRSEKQLTQMQISNAHDVIELIKGEKIGLINEMSEAVKQHIKLFDQQNFGGGLTLVGEITIVDKESLDDMFEWMEEARKIMEKFVDKCDTGRAKSKETYAEMKKRLSKV